MSPTRTAVDRLLAEHAGTFRSRAADGTSQLAVPGGWEPTASELAPTRGRDRRTFRMDLVFFSLSLVLDLVAAVGFVAHVVVGRETPRRLALGALWAAFGDADDRAGLARRDARHRRC